MRIPAPPRREEGSAYIVALMVLVVLTILGMGLALITQTEVQVGANERTINRVFYAADAAISVSIARMLVTNDVWPRTYYLDDPVAGGIDIGLRNTAETTGMVQWTEMPCNLCQINNATHYSGKRYIRSVMLTNVTAQRIASANPDAAPLAERTLGAMVDVQPIEASIERTRESHESGAAENVRN